MRFAASRPAERCSTPPAYGAPYGGSMLTAIMGLLVAPTRRDDTGGPLVRRGGIKPPAADRKPLNSYRLIFPRRGGGVWDHLGKSGQRMGQLLAASFCWQLSAPA